MTAQTQSREKESRPAGFLRCRRTATRPVKVTLPGVMAELVVLAQQIFPVVVAVGRAHDDVNVVFVRFRMLPERNAALVIELHDDHRALNAVVKCAVVFDAAHPAEVSLVQVPLHLRQFDFGVAIAHPSNVVREKLN